MTNRKHWKKLSTKQLVSKWETGTSIAEEIAEHAIDKHEDLVSIIQWQKETFPHATLVGQTIKYAEEIEELKNTIPESPQRLQELADLFIVACGILNQDLLIGLDYMKNTTNIIRQNCKYWDQVQAEIDYKMAKNRARKWEYLDNGNYHHVKGVED